MTTHHSPLTPGIQHGLSVAVAEPNPISRWLFKLALEGVGYHVLETADGMNGHASPDLLLLNLGLPDSAAEGLARRCRALPEGKNVPIVAFSDNLECVQDAKNRNGLFTGFLLKPFLPSHLLLTLQFYLRGKIPIRQRPLSVERARLSQESYSEGARQAAGKIGVGGRRILIVENHAGDREEMAGKLRQAGFHTSTAANGVAGLEEALKDPPDAIISSTLLPGMDGFELSVGMRLLYQTALIPILLVPAGHIEEVDRYVAHRVGANGVVSRKPDFHKVVDALIHILGEEAPALWQVPGQLPRDRRQLLSLFK